MTVLETEKKQSGGRHKLSGPGPGRPKGSKDKFTTLKQAFLDAFEKTGGAAGLAAWIARSEHNRAIFYQLVTKLFPQEVAHSGEVKATLSFKFGDNGNGEAHE
jgi:hypothetical protein